jgi:hypothetical protein
MRAGRPHVRQVTARIALVQVAHGCRKHHDIARGERVFQYEVTHGCGAYRHLKQLLSKPGNSSPRWRILLLMSMFQQPHFDGLTPRSVLSTPATIFDGGDYMTCGLLYPAF